MYTNRVTFQGRVTYLESIERNKTGPYIKNIILVKDVSFLLLSFIIRLLTP
jgi:hypothetical protein